MYRVELIKNALVIAGDGACWPWLRKYWRTRAVAPAVAGVEWEVPEEAVNHSCPLGQKFPGPPHTPLASKQLFAWPSGLPGGSARWPAAWATPPLTWVPGAMKSGLRRPSEVGPRLEKKATSKALSAAVSATPHWSAAPKGCTFSEAPEVMMFFAVPGSPTVLAPGPALPAAKTITISWLPATGTAEAAGAASRTSASYRCESVV